jgi:hypothetical protein
LYTAFLHNALWPSLEIKMHPSSFQKLALASQLTPPPSPDDFKLGKVEKVRANSGRIRRPRLPEPLLLVDSTYNTPRKNVTHPSQNSSFKVSKRDTTFLDPTRNSSVISTNSDPQVSPISSCCSDIKELSVQSFRDNAFANTKKGKSRDPYH